MTRCAATTSIFTVTDPDWIEYPGAPREHLYTNQIRPYHRAPHIYMGFPKRFLPGRKSPIGHALPGVSDGVFMTSRDGKNFHRWTEAFIRPGPRADRWVCRNNMTAWGIIDTKSNIAGAPDELSFFVVASYYTGKECRTLRYTLRQDGFASINAPLRGGEVVTKPFIFAGSRLNINFATSAAGTVKVEVQDAGGTPVAGYTLADCPEIYGDSLSRTVAWQGDGDLSELAGKPIRLRFTLSDADVYAIQFK